MAESVRKKDGKQAEGIPYGGKVPCATFPAGAALGASGPERFGISQIRTEDDNRYQRTVFGKVGKKKIWYGGWFWYRSSPKFKLERGVEGR